MLSSSPIDKPNSDNLSAGRQLAPHLGERLLDIRGEGLAGSLVRLSFCAALTTAGQAIPKLGPEYEMGPLGAMGWFGRSRFVGGCALGSCLWITDRCVVAKV